VTKKYSGKRVIKAGEELKDLSDEQTDEEFRVTFDVLSYWRFGHEYPLNNALSLLREVVLKKDKKAIFAKRLKRHVSIFRKLIRFEKMNLKNMQDIGGCRAVISSEKKLRQSVRELKKLPAFKGRDGSYRFKDYIKSPKEDGYRSYHLIGKFVDSEGELKNIEIQLRTNIQHYWATALEIVDLFTDQALKSNQGEEAWKVFFIEVSKQFALFDEIHLFETLSESERMDKYAVKISQDEALKESCVNARNLLRELKVKTKLEAFAKSINIVGERLGETPDAGYVLLKINTIESVVNSKIFSKDESKTAEENYVEAEKEAVQTEGLVVALVSSSAVGGIKEVYPNYFADSSKFLELIPFISSVRI
jgi:ppGpp synthetase/RelA/SpoT-type nucleotidyltranferase